MCTPKNTHRYTHTCMYAFTWRCAYTHTSDFCCVFVSIITLVFLTRVSLSLPHGLSLLHTVLSWFSGGGQSQHQGEINGHTEQSGGRALLRVLPPPSCGTVDEPLPFPQSPTTGTLGVDWLGGAWVGPTRPRLEQAPCLGGDKRSPVYGSWLQPVQSPIPAYLRCF